MRYLLIALCAIAVFSCKKEAKPVPVVEAETIDTLYAWYHVWIGPHKWIDSAYSEWLSKEGAAMTTPSLRRRFAKDKLK